VRASRDNARGTYTLEKRSRRPKRKRVKRKRGSSSNAKAKKCKAGQPLNRRDMQKRRSGKKEN